MKHKKEEQQKNTEKYYPHRDSIMQVRKYYYSLSKKEKTAYMLYFFDAILRNYPSEKAKKQRFYGILQGRLKIHYALIEQLETKFKQNASKEIIDL